MITSTKSVLYLFGLATLSIGLIGCAANKELADTQLALDECRLELKALQEQMDFQEGDGSMRAQRDRLAAENAHLKRQISQMEEREQQLRKTIHTTKAENPADTERIAALQAELKQALDNMRTSRIQWENTLADRQRQIDMLKNQIQRLEKELQANRDYANATTQPQ